MDDSWFQYVLLVDLVSSWGEPVGLGDLETLTRAPAPSPSIRQSEPLRPRLSSLRERFDGVRWTVTPWVGVRFCSWVGVVVVERWTDAGLCPSLVAVLSAS